MGRLAFAAISGLAIIVILGVILGAFELSARAGCGCELWSLELKSRVAVETKQTQVPSPDGKPPGYRFLPYAEFDGNRTNNLGLVMDHDVTPAKPPGVLRLAAIGSSTTQGFLHGDYPSSLEAILSSAEPAENWQVINAGHQGYGLKDVIAFTEMDVLPLSPDVLVYYGEINDIAAYKTVGYYPDGQPWSVQASLGAYANVRKYSAFGTFTLLPLIGDNWPFTGAIEHFDWPTLLAPWQSDIEGLLDFAAEHKLRVLLSTYAYGWQPGTPATQPMRQLTQAGGWPVMAHPLEQFGEGIAAENTIIRRVAAERGLAVAPVAEQLDERRELFYDVVHMNADGYHQIAEIIGQTLLDPNQGAVIPRPR